MLGIPEKFPRDCSEALLINRNIDAKDSSSSFIRFSINPPPISPLKSGQSLGI